MLKILIGFIVFAALALYLISKGGDSVDMSGEKHGSETHAPAATEPAPAPAAAPASEVAPAAVAASAASS